MTNAAGQRDTSRSPDNTGFGSVRVQAKRGDEGRFYLGLVALVAIMVFATLAVIALLPTLVPRATSASITSGSMMPKLRPGDVVIAVDQGDTPIAIGTIVVFEDPRAGGLVTHRIAGINPDGTYTTKGDANGVVDPAPVPPANVRGVGRWVVPYVGLPSVWLSESRWLPLALTIAAIAGAVWLVRYAVEVRYDPWDDRAQDAASQSAPASRT
ncbi:MAG: signal peptidase I [Acidimicrobiia bacterium]